MPFVDLPGVRLHYSFAGPAGAPALVLSNSLGTNFSMWDAQAPAFGKQFRLLRYDMRGHGQSSAPPPPYAVPDLARDILALADSLDIGRFHFCGLSIGGMIGMSLALRAPERLHKLVLANTAPQIGTNEFWNARIQAVETKGMKEIAAAFRPRLFTPSSHSSPPASVKPAKSIFDSRDPSEYMGGCTAVRDFNFRTQVSKTRPQPRFIPGTHAPAATPA